MLVKRIFPTSKIMQTFKLMLRLCNSCCVIYNSCRIVSYSMMTKRTSNSHSSSSLLNRLRINGACSSRRTCHVRTPGSTTRITPPLPSHPHCSCFGLVPRGTATSASKLNRTSVNLSWVCVGARRGSLPPSGVYPPLEITR